MKRQRAGSRRLDRPSTRPGRGPAVAALLLALAGSFALAFAPAAAATTTHVDCQAPGPGDGSKAEPLDSLAAANAVSLAPGDALLFRRGTGCEGTLSPQGAGSPEAPVTIGAWGSGPRPQIIGSGTSAVNLTDRSNLVIEDLDISNPGGGAPLGEGIGIRNGVVIRAATVPVEGVTVRRLAIHDVGGDLTKNPQGSAGILVTADGPPPVRFRDLAIEENEISSVSRSAISIYGSEDLSRPPAGEPWPEASTGVLIRGNRIDRFAGDGIVSRGTDGAIIENNLVSRGNLAGRKLGDPQGEVCNAGIWAFRANNTVIRENEVYGMRAGCDGTGFDLDYNQDGTIIERNYSHDNEGGFVLLCADSDRRGEVRFNLSVNDASTINHGPCAGHFGDLGGIRFFNNTVVAPSPNASMQLIVQNRIQLAGSFEFRNNLIYATTRQNAPLPCGNHCSNNLFFNLPPSGSAAVAASPRLINPNRIGTGRLTVGQSFRLRANSPARKAGVRLPAMGSADFFGTPLNPSGRPAIGFDQTPAARSKPVPTRACRQARRARQGAVRRLRSAKKALRRLRQRQGTRRKLNRAARRVRSLRRKAARQTRLSHRSCRT